MSNRTQSIFDGQLIRSPYYKNLLGSMSQLKKNQSLRSLMDTFFLLVHIAFGSVALLAAALAFLTKKGPKFHAKVGRVYALAMIGVGLTAGALWWLGSTDFLLFIAFFSTYMVLVGWARAESKRFSRQHRSSACWGGNHRHIGSSVHFSRYCILG